MRKLAWPPWPSSGWPSSVPLVLGFVLINCLITTTAYDDKFVNRILSNRTVVDNGLSLNGTSLQHLKHNRLKDHSVRCLLNVENWTAWRLKDALPHNHCGYIDEMYTAVNVRPATREVMLGYKQSGTATGTCGTVSWQVEHLDTRLIVMWSVPFNYNIHNSYFAVGMIFNRGKFSSSSYWFNQMYYSEKGPYKRGSGGQTITYENSAIVVVAHMEASTYHPMLNISVIPQVPYKLAPKVWKRLYKLDKAPFQSGVSPVRAIFGGSRGYTGAWLHGFVSTLGVAIIAAILSTHLMIVAPSVGGLQKSKGGHHTDIQQSAAPTANSNQRPKHHKRETSIPAEGCEPYSSESSISHSGDPVLESADDQLFTATQNQQSLSKPTNLHLPAVSGNISKHFTTECDRLTENPTPTTPSGVSRNYSSSAHHRVPVRTSRDKAELFSDDDVDTASTTHTAKTSIR